MRGKKIGIIIIIIILIIAIVAGVTTYLFLKTDVFKGKNQVFFKYMSQVVEQVEEIANSKTLENYKKEMINDKYETNTSIDFKYSEGGEVSSGYNNLNLNMKTQSDEGYKYKNAQILFGDKSIVQVEGIQEDNLYGIRFTNIFNQFVTLKDAKNIEGLNLTDENIEMIKDIIEDNEEFYNGILLTKQDYEKLKEKYMQIVVDALNGGTFSKQGKSIITVDSQTIKTTSYSCELNSLQVQNLVIKLLNNLKNDDIILNKVQNLLNDTKKYENYIEKILRSAEDMEFSNLKITVYEQKGKVVRTLANIGTNSITIEESEQNNKTVLKIKHELLNNEKENKQQIIISKSTTDSNEEYVINIETVDGDDEYSIETTMSSDYKSINLNIDFYKDIININIKAQSNISEEIDQKLELNSSNNVLLNDLNSELLKEVVDKMTSAYNDTLLKRYNILIRKLNSENLMETLKSIISEGKLDEDTTAEPEDTSIDRNQVTKEEINRFNAKFEFYSGTEISGETVKVLLDVVKNNLESVEVTPIETQNTYNNEEKESIKLNIKKDNENIDLANGIIEKISSNVKYDITINYNKGTGIIESIIIVPSK